MIEEYRVNGFTHLIIPPEGKRYVADATACFGIFQVFLDPAHGIDEVHRIIIVLLHPGTDDQDIRIEDNILWREVNLVDKYIVGTLADFNPSLERIGLSFFVESHNNHRCPVSFQQLSLFAEGRFTLLHTY